MMATAELGRYGRLLQSALSHVASDVPEAHQAFVQAIEATPLALQIAEERFVLVGDRVISEQPQNSAARLRIQPRPLLELIEGRQGLTEALASDDLQLVGSVDAVVAVDRALQLLLHGVLRSRAAPDLLHQLRTINAFTFDPSLEETS